MKKSFVTLSLTAVLASAVLTGCGQTQDNNSASPKAGEKVLTMATSADYPPYESHDTTSGSDQIIGFDIDIANWIAKDQGFTLKVVDTDFNGLLPMLQAKRADFVMAGMTASEERKKNAEFSEPYFVAKNTIIEKKGTGLKTSADLKGKKVAVQLGSMQEAAAKKMAGLNLVPLNKTGDIIQEVKAGRVDAAIIEDTVAKGFVQKNTDLEYNTIPESESQGSSVAFPKNSTLVANFNTSLKKLKDSGEMDKLVQKWFGK